MNAILNDLAAIGLLWLIGAIPATIVAVNCADSGTWTTRQATSVVFLWPLAATAGAIWLTVYCTRYAPTAARYLIGGAMEFMPQKSPPHAAGDPVLEAARREVETIAPESR